MWVGTTHELRFHAVTSVETKKGFVVIRTTNMAPEQGPSIQRASDEEATNRMCVEHLQRMGEVNRLHPRAEEGLAEVGRDVE
jgi:hypothetical protein